MATHRKPATTPKYHLKLKSWCRPNFGISETAEYLSQAKGNSKMLFKTKTFAYVSETEESPQANSNSKLSYKTKTLA